MLDLELIGAPAYALEVVDGTFRYIGMNARLEALTGFTFARLRGLTPHHCLPPQMADTIVERYDRAVQSHTAIEYEEFFQLPNRSCWLAITVTPVIHPTTRKVITLLGIAADVTARRTAELAHEEAVARLSLAMEAIEGGFWHLDVASNEFQTSRSLAAFVAGEGSPELDLAGYLSYIAPEDLPAADLSAMIAGFRNESVAEYRVKTFSGETRWMRCSQKLIRDGQDRPRRIVGVAMDVTEQKALQARYRLQASTDVLTGLVNRRSLEVQAQRRLMDARTTGRRFGFVLLGLDRFKPVNDDFGHAVGDAVLREVAARLRDATREQDVVARFGGDEFAILLDDVDPPVLPRLCRSIVKSFSTPFTIDGRSIRLGVSVGATADEPTDRTIEDLALRADRDLHMMKKSNATPGVSAA